VAKKGELLIQKYRMDDDMDALRQSAAEYENALGIMPRSHQPVYADVSFDAGNAFRELAAVEEDEKLCEQALAAFEASLAYYSEDVDRLNNALILWNIAMTYHVFHACSGESKYLAKAASSFEESYSILSGLGKQKEAAQVAFSLGTTYGDLAYAQSPVKHMRKAVSAYELAAGAYSEIDVEAEGETLIRIGNLQVGLAQAMEDPAYIDHAIESYRRAEQIFTLDTYPDIYAQVSWSMGLAATVATTLRENSEDTILLRQSYGNALKVYTSESMPNEWFHGNLNIGLSYLVDNLAAPDTDTYLKALEAFEQAWSAGPGSVDAKLRAKVAHHYGTTLLSLEKEDRPEAAAVRAAEMIEESISALPDEQEMREKLSELLSAIND
jgi:tetratricopeptide (TPR) repeat protein